MRPIISTLVLILLTGASVAHPGESIHHVRAEARKRAEFLESLEHPADMSHCHSEMAANGQAERLMRRRLELVEAHRRERDLHYTPMLSERDLIGVLGKDHKSSQKLTPGTPTSQIFGPSKACVLSPETTEGPFYATGEMIRQNISEGQLGVPLTLDLLVLDHKTCKPVLGEFIEIWNTNATGIYGNVASTMNGNVGDTKNLNNTMFRGYQQLDQDGVAQFNTMVPGHYPIRANHIHVMIHIGATKLPNNTIQGGTGTVSHTGQFYMDQSLLDVVEKTAPYNTNKQSWTKNAQDSLIGNGAANNDDPFINYVLLGSKVEDGLFGWITIGVDTTAKRTISAATWWGSSGGLKNPNGGGIGGFGGGGFGGGFGGFGGAGGAAGGTQKPPQ